jgi:hypothetical protein
MPAIDTDRRFFTPPQLAKRFGVAPEKIIGWIRRGELAAINLAAAPGGRPRYRVSLAEVLGFERRRAVIPRSATTPRPRRRRRSPHVVDFF